MSDDSKDDTEPQAADAFDLEKEFTPSQRRMHEYDTDDLDLDSQACRVLEHLTSEGGGSLLRRQGEPLATILPHPETPRPSGYAPCNAPFDQLTDAWLVKLTAFVAGTEIDLGVDAGSGRLLAACLAESKRRGWPEGWWEDPSVVPDRMATPEVL